MAANRGPLSERIFHILGRRPFGAGRRVLGLTGSILFLAAALGAANALFGIAYPLPVAHAKANLNAALPSSQVAIDRMARQVRVTGNRRRRPSDQQRNDANGQEEWRRQIAESTPKPPRPKNCWLPSPDLSRLLPRKAR